jgi:hypothetical protein
MEFRVAMPPLEASLVQNASPLGGRVKPPLRDGASRDFAHEELSSTVIIYRTGTANLPSLSLQRLLTVNAQVLMPPCHS